MPRPRVTFSRNGTHVLGLAPGPPNETSSRASYGATVGVRSWRAIVPYARERCSPATAPCWPVPARCGSAPTALVARLPISIDTLGIVLLVTGLGRSYGLAGALSAAYTIANGLMAIVQGRLLDRLGQARVLPVVGVGLRGRDRGARASASSRGWPDAVAFVAAAAGRRGLPADRLVRAGALVLRARRRAGRDPDGVRAGVGDRRGDLHHRPDRGHRARHHLAPVGRARARARHRRRRLALRWPRSAPPSPTRTRRDHAAGARPPMPWRLGRAAGRGLLRPRLAVRRRRGDHGRLLRRAGRQVVRRACCSRCWALGSMLAGLVTGTLHWRRAGRRSGCRSAASVLALVMLPMAFVGSMAVMGAGAVRRRLRHRADPDRHDGRDRAEVAAGRGSPRASRSCTPASPPGSPRAPRSPAW